jgi:hypothetical protein
MWSAVVQVALFQGVFGLVWKNAGGHERDQALYARKPCCFQNVQINQDVIPEVLPGMDGIAAQSTYDCCAMNDFFGSMLFEKSIRCFKIGQISILPCQKYCILIRKNLTKSMPKHACSTGDQILCHSERVFSDYLLHKQLL